MLNEIISNDQNKKNQEYSEEDPEDETEDSYLVYVERTQKVIFEGGRKKNKITLSKYYSDGHFENDVKIEPLIK